MPGVAREAPDPFYWDSGEENPRKVYWKHFKGWGLCDFSQQQGAPQVAGGLLMTGQSLQGVPVSFTIAPC